VITTYTVNNVYGILKHNQQDATCIIFFIVVSAVHCDSKFEWITHANKFRLTYDSGSSKQVWQVSDVACTVFELLMMRWKTARNMYSIDNNKEYCTRCILLVVLKNTLMMHGPMNVKSTNVKYICGLQLGPVPLLVL